MGERLVQVINTQLQEGRTIRARDLTLAAYSFAKLGFFQRDVFEAVAAGALPVARNFTARDLQMILVAFARAQYFNQDFVHALTAQTSRRIAQFNAETLAQTLRPLAFFRVRDDTLLNLV